MLNGFGAVALTAVAITATSESRATAASAAYTYADLADLALPAPVVASVRLARASLLKPRDARGVPAGHSRFYIEAEVVSLIRGAGGLPTSVRYLADVPNGPSGRPVRLQKGSQWLIFAEPVPGRPGELRLRGRDGQIPFQPAVAERLRGLLNEASQPGAAPAVTGIGRAFHVPGSLPGESETQIFLQTAENRPVSLSILRRPGQVPTWSVALAEIVDETASAPRRETLLWYRLACTLPGRLPPQSLADAEPDTAAAIAVDYQVVLAGLGPCERSRTAR